MKRRIFKGLSILFLLTLPVIGYYILATKFQIYIPCIFHKITHFYCPGCGLTRLLSYLFDLEIYKAFRMNPLVFIYLPFILFYFGYQIYLFITSKKDKIICKIPKFVWTILIIITLSFGILRNIPAFSFLAPTVI